MKVEDSKLRYLRRGQLTDMLTNHTLVQPHLLAEQYTHILSVSRVFRRTVVDAITEPDPVENTPLNHHAPTSAHIHLEHFSPTGSGECPLFAEDVLQTAMATAARNDPTHQRMPETHQLGDHINRWDHVRVD